MRTSILCLIGLLAACAPGEERTRNEQASEQAAPLSPIANRAQPSEPGIDPRSPEAAVAVLRRYFALIADRRYADAYRLWSDRGRASGMSQAAFAASFDQYRSYQGSVGAVGNMEGAAGSSYIDIAAEVTGRMKDGTRFRQSGTMTLRRANDVPGATPEQLQWRIYQNNLKPHEVTANYRFVGRWATEERNCGSGAAWRFTADWLTTPAGSICRFRTVTEVPGGYDIAARCTAEGTQANDTLRLRFAESARALLFESNVIADAGLVRCR